MKKKIVIILCMFFLLITGRAFADNSPKVYLYETLLNVESPMIFNGVTLVPLRALFEFLGSNVSWDDSSKTVYAKKSGTEISIQIGSNQVFKNGNPIMIEEPARIINDKTYVPLRFIAESFDLTVNWDKENNSIFLGKPLVESVYLLELDRWGIYNDGTHPIETTKGFNEALQWANANGKTTFKVPAGTYTIAKGTKEGATDARINMVSNITFLLDEKTVLQKETNGYESYSLLEVGTGVKNVTIKGGTLVGDRDTHDYSGKGPGTFGTHEWGHGIHIAGAENVVVDGVSIQKFTGDGIEIIGTTIIATNLTEPYLEKGSLDDRGNPVNAEGKIRTVGRTQTNFDNTQFKVFPNVNMWLPQGLADNNFDVCYYRADNSFIKCDRQLKVFSDSSILPPDADYFRAVFDAASTKGVAVTSMTIANAKNIVIQNNDIGYNRRQGITAGGENVQIRNNKIHHTSGTAPESGIDIEPGFFPAKNFLIKGNEFYNNKIQVVLSYGDQVTFEENNLKQEDIPGSVGFFAHDGFRGLSVTNNTFNGSGLELQNENAVASGNTFINSSAALSGANIKFENAVMTDSKLSLGEKAGTDVSNVTIINTGKSGKYKGTLAVWEQPVHLKDLTIKGSVAEGDVIFGYGSKDTVFENLVLENTNSSNLPAGTYKGCSFVSDSPETIAYSMNYPNTVIDGCTFKNRTLLPYNLNADVVVKNSTFVFDGDLNDPAVYAIQAKNLSVLNNNFQANHLKSTYHPLIKFGRYAWQTLKTDVHGAAASGNTISTNIPSRGIDTTDGGVDSPPYTIIDNILYNAKLYVTPKDISTGNQELSK